MGLFSFVKDAGEKLWDTFSGNSTEAQAEKLKKYVNDLNLPGTDKLHISVTEDGTATVSGDVVSQEDKEKILVSLGNIKGISHVNDEIAVMQSAVESRYYTVMAGDTLSAISKIMYGSASDYQLIFDANKPMLQHPDKIYPGQVLIIPNK